MIERGCARMVNFLPMELQKKTLRACLSCSLSDIKLIRPNACRSDKGIDVVGIRICVIRFNCVIFLIMPLDLEAVKARVH